MIPFSLRDIFISFGDLKDRAFGKIFLDTSKRKWRFWGTLSEIQVGGNG